ncbi:glycosyltransferase [Kitasatospora sp. NPDC051914]|uniref:glycosyltransferase n=1 Tax=Kitasatospora sp. NPDC051914 TaxID=3154945 RepID=UPI00342CDB10
MIVSIVLIVFSVFLFGMATGTLWWMMHAWRTPENLEDTRFAEADGAERLSFSLLVPARHEQEVLAHTVDRLLTSRYRHYEVLVIVGHDDPGTTAVANELTARHPGRVRVVVDTHETKSKPKALNTALPHCRGDVVGVFDAEDQVHPDLLGHVDHAFRSADVAVVQGGVQLINFDSSWYSLRNCMEYFFWFRSRLHLHARHGFIPLGGNTVFVRSEVLRDAGGWDPDCLAEDCDLGVRLSCRGARVVVAYDAELVTREETPDSLYGLLKQRTRWNQGFLQVYRKREWTGLPARQQRLLARWTLGNPFLQAAAGVVIPIGIALALLAEIPVAAAMITFVPLLPALLTVAFEAVGLHDFGVQYGMRVRPRHYVKLIAGSPLYQLVLSAAAMRAVWRETRGQHGWELTRHVGAHIQEIPNKG